MKTRQRESSAALTSNDGFSVVAPMSTTVPRSTWGRIASCCALLKRWISSMKRMVRCPVARSSLPASSTTRRRSATPAVTAERATKRARVPRAMTLASVVLPLPGGPQKIIEGTTSRSSARRSARPGPSRCSCPTTSSSVRGRMRSARGRACSGNASLSAGALRSRGQPCRDEDGDTSESPKSEDCCCWLPMVYAS